VRPETRLLAEECGKPLPRDSAPNRSLLEKVAASHALRAVRLRSTVFVTDLFDNKDGKTVSKLIRRCTPSEYRVWLKCMTGTYPVQVYFKRIGKAQSPICPHCGEGAPESLMHFACICPKFREARTSAHNQVRDVITSFLHSALGAEWTMYEETRMSRTGLILSSTPQATAEQWGRRQPDWVLVSQHHKRIAIVDLCRPSDVHPDQLLAAAMRKDLPLQEALSFYSDQGWTIHVFPWVVGIRGMIDPSHVHALLKFLELPNRHWHLAVDRMVLASVRALSFLHKVRFGGLPETVLPDLDPDHSEEGSDDVGRGKRVQRKPYRNTTDAPQDFKDSDTPEDADGLGERSQSRKKSCLPLSNQGVGVSPADTAALPSAARAVDHLTPSPQPRISCAVSGPRRRRVTRQSHFKQRAAQTRAVVRAKPLDIPARCAEPPRPGWRQRPKRKRWERTSIPDASDQADIAQRPAKRPYRANPEGPPEVLWDRWRRMEPRRKRRA
jgi:hypothetical protein